MIANTLGSAPILSTPDTHVLEDPTPTIDVSSVPRLSDEQVALTYEIERTVREIREGRWTRIALQFPDQMLVDAPRVYKQLVDGLQKERLRKKRAEDEETEVEDDAVGAVARRLDDVDLEEKKVELGGSEEEENFFILGDTSYGACCVDEVAAEHVDADVVVHYGRSCLSPPSRLPVIYAFTERELNQEALFKTFVHTFLDKGQHVILMADIPYAHHIPNLHARLLSAGYTGIHATEIIHNPSSLLPNRTVPPEATEDASSLRSHDLFHISDPPPSLLLTLSSRVSAIHIYPTSTPSPSTSTVLASTTLALRRRYALVTSLTTAPILGILINTLSVKNYMHILAHVQRMITSAGKKYYTFVVGKVNAAKVANFSEVGGWIVIGCWESSLLESAEFWRPVVTPFELGMVLQSDEERIWTGEWRGDFEAVLAARETQVRDAAAAASNGDVHTNGHAAPTEDQSTTFASVNTSHSTPNANANANADYDYDDDDEQEESAPPEFDLRTGRYVSHSRPLRTHHTSLPPSAPSETPTPTTKNTGDPSTALTLHPKQQLLPNKSSKNHALALVGGVPSPGALFLREGRTWQGLGSDFGTRGEEEQEGEVGRGGEEGGASMEEGRSGIARGYVVGDARDVR